MEGWDVCAEEDDECWLALLCAEIPDDPLCTWDGYDGYDGYECYEGEDCWDAGY